MKTCLRPRSGTARTVALRTFLGIILAGMPPATGAETPTAPPPASPAPAETDTSRGVQRRDAATPPAAPAVPPYARVQVLCIGINNTPKAPAYLPLRYAEQDAQDLADKLRSSFRFATTVLSGPRATKQGIEAAIQTLRQNLRTNDDFILYFAGHGTTTDDPTKQGVEAFERTGFLIPASAKLGPKPTYRDLQEQGIDMKELARSLCVIPARHRLLFLDCCFSGYATQFKQRKEVKYSPLMLTHPTVQVITAGTDQELSVEFEELRHGVFTYELLELLASPEDYSLDEIFYPLRRAVVKRAQEKGRTLTPTLRSLIESDGDFVFVPAERQATWAVRAGSGSTRPAGTDRGAGAPVTDQEVLAAAEVKEGSVKPDDPAWQARVARYEERAAMGDPNAMAALVQLYGKGAGTPKNPQKANQWAREGFDSGTPVGKGALASALKFGYGGKIDIKGADLIAAALPRVKGADFLVALLGGTSTSGSAIPLATPPEAAGGGIKIPGVGSIPGIPNPFGGGPKDPEKELAKQLKSLGSTAADIEQDLAKNRYTKAQDRVKSLETKIGELSKLTGQGVGQDKIQDTQGRLTPLLQELSGAINAGNKESAQKALLQFNSKVNELTPKGTKK